jgi:hypothetical protein
MSSNNSREYIDDLVYHNRCGNVVVYFDVTDHTGGEIGEVLEYLYEKLPGCVLDIQYPEDSYIEEEILYFLEGDTIIHPDGTIEHVPSWHRGLYLKGAR